jgi:ABC-type metal ion transport system substrate-binding protein
MKKFLVVLIAFCLCGICMNATAQTKEIRVLVANHPYGDLLKTAKTRHRVCDQILID